MKLEFLKDVNAYDESILRLYDFDLLEARSFRNAIQQIIVEEKKSLNLNQFSFIQLLNCKLILRISDTDEGIITEDYKHFYCDLTVEKYNEMLLILAPFCVKENQRHKYLYDLDNPIEFLFAPNGTSVE